MTFIPLPFSIIQSYPMKTFFVVASMVNFVIMTETFAQTYNHKSSHQEIRREQAHVNHKHFQQPQYLIEYGQTLMKESFAWRDRKEEEPQGQEEHKPSPQVNETSSNSENESSADDTDTTLSPLDQTIQALTTPEQLIPILNDLTFIALVILFLPVIIPTMLIPLGFFAVGTLLIPIVRVNYFINHEDDGEDGRSLSPLPFADNLLGNFVTLIQSVFFNTQKSNLN